jgi:hypothetical protein
METMVELKRRPGDEVPGLSSQSALPEAICWTFVHRVSLKRSLKNDSLAPDPLTYLSDMLDPVVRRQAKIHELHRPLVCNWNAEDAATIAVAA